MHYAQSGRICNPDQSDHRFKGVKISINKITSWFRGVTPTDEHPRVSLGGLSPVCHHKVRKATILTYSNIIYHQWPYHWELGYSIPSTLSNSIQGFTEATLRHLWRNWNFDLVRNLIFPCSLQSWQKYSSITKSTQVILVPNLCSIISKSTVKFVFVGRGVGIPRHFLIKRTLYGYLLSSSNKRAT